MPSCVPDPALDPTAHPFGGAYRATPVPYVPTIMDRLEGELASLGLEIFPSDQQTPEALRAFHKAEIEKWWPIIKAANIKAD